MYAQEYAVVPELDTQGAKQDTNMTKTTEGLLSELNKTDEQNTNHEANIFEDKDDENEKNTSCNNQQSDVHMLQQIECMDGTKQEFDRGCLQQPHMETKMGYAITEYSKLLAMVQTHERFAKGINEIINEGDTLPETHYASMPPVIHSVNQGLEVKARNGNFNAR